MQMTQMTDAVDVDRRTVLRGVGAVAVTGALAGCGGDSGGGDDGGDGGGDGGDDGGDQAEVPSEVDDYLSEANNYEGSAADETNSDSVSVDVGAGGQGIAFGPAAVRVSTGTTVTWEWTGNGGAHNVVAEDETFDSGSTQSDGTFEYTFDEAGNYNYYCTPHKGSGMKGAIIVE